jgi:hypothetical protein
MLLYVGDHPADVHHHSAAAFQNLQKAVQILDVIVKRDTANTIYRREPRCDTTAN